MKELFNNCIQNLETYIMFKIGEEVARIKPELEAMGKPPISLTLGAPVAKPPQYVIDRLKYYMDQDNIHTYSSPRGEKRFLQAACQRMKNRFGIEIDPACEIFSLIGAKEGIANLIRALINSTTVESEKEIILIPDPGYASYKEMIKVSGGISYPMPMMFENDYMPDFEQVWENLKKDGYNEKKVKAFILNYPNNPLGATCNLEYMKKAVEFARKHNILLISDAAYTDLYFDENDIPGSIFQIEGAKDVAVEFYTLSKPYAMTGWRIGWICGNKEVIKFFGKQKSTIDTGIFKAIQLASADILVSKEGDDYIKKSNIDFRRKQQICLDGFKKLGWDSNKFKVPNATFYLWLPIPPRYNTSEEFTNDLMYKSGIILVPGSAFGKYGEGFFRISVVCEDEKLYEMFDRMQKDGFYYDKQVVLC